MSEQRAKLIAEMRSMHNHIGISIGGELARLIGFHEDEQDFYYHEVHLGGQEVYASAVGRFISLKDFLEAGDYLYLEQMFSLNGAPTRCEFSISGQSMEVDTLICPSDC